MKEDCMSQTIILTEDSQIEYFDIFEKFGEIFRPETEQDYEDQINF
jgi:hypothetical protein